MVVPVATIALLFAAHPGCGGATDQGLIGGGDDASSSDDASVHGDATVDGSGDDGGNPDARPLDTAPPCVNLECQVAHCTPGTETTLTGTVYDPAAVDPLYDVTVYVPNKKPDALKDGVSCDKCDVLVTGAPLVKTSSGADGTFTLKNVPSGMNIPLVMQIGKWRRQVTIPNIPSCATTTLVDKNLTRLPKDKTEGDIPLIAITTGGCDPFECLLRNIGIADSEFTAPTGTGRVHVYQGGVGTGGVTGSQIPGSTAVATSLWSDRAALAKYDLQINSCECSEAAPEKPQATLDNIVDYANKGGRLFTTHYQYYFIDPKIVTPAATAPWETTATFITEIAGATTATATIDTSFTRGAAFAQWLVAVGASTTIGSLTVNDVRYNASAVNMPSTRWMSAPQSGALAYTFKTPVGVAEPMQCGKVFFGDFHAAGSSNGMNFPQECTGNTLTPQQKAFEFMLFELSGCLP